MTIRSRGARIPNAAWCSEVVRSAFVARQETEQEPDYGACTTVQSHRKAARKSSATPRMPDTVTVTFADCPAKPEPVVSTGEVERDATFDFTGAPTRTIIFSALPGPAVALETAGRDQASEAELRRTSPYSGVSSLSYSHIFPAARTVHAPR
jgi:hypothetical protein